MKIKKNKIFFSSGREKYGYRGIIGLSPDFDVTSGFDDRLHYPREDWMEDEDYDGLTKEEQIELADYMIEQWTKFKAKASPT